MMSARGRCEVRREERCEEVRLLRRGIQVKEGRKGGRRSLEGSIRSKEVRE